MQVLEKNSHLEWAECNLEYLQQEVGWIVQQHHNCTNPNVVVTVGEANQWDGGNVMNDLLFEVLQATDMTDYSFSLASNHYYSFQWKQLSENVLILCK